MKLRKNDKLYHLKRGKIEADKEWDIAFTAALKGNIDRDKLVAAMAKCNGFDSKLLKEKYHTIKEFP